MGTLAGALGRDTLAGEPEEVLMGYAGFIGSQESALLSLGWGNQGCNPFSDETDTQQIQGKIRKQWT